MLRQKRRGFVSTLCAALAAVALTLNCGARAVTSSEKATAGAGTRSHQARFLKITVLVTNLAGDPHEGDAEWGYSALVEVDGHKILYDTGASGRRPRIPPGRPLHRHRGHVSAA